MLGFLHEPDEGHVRAAARSCWSTSIAGNHASIPRRPPATQQGRALPGRSTEGGGDHRRHPRCWRPPEACRLRGLWSSSWRAGLRIQEALAEADLDHRRGALLVRRGKGGRCREVGVDAWGWEELRPPLALRVPLPVGPRFCIITGPTRSRPWSSAAARAYLRRTPRRPVSVGASRHTISGTPTPSRRTPRSTCGCCSTVGSERRVSAVLPLRLPYQSSARSGSARQEGSVTTGPSGLQRSSRARMRSAR
jgi:hypothetical protein